MGDAFDLPVGHPNRAKLSGTEQDTVHQLHIEIINKITLFQSTLKKKPGKKLIISVINKLPGTNLLSKTRNFLEDHNARW